MTTLVLTVAGADRTGLVEAVARVVADHGGNWERSELAELAGTFAGVVLVTVPDAREADLRAALAGLEGLLEVTARGGVERASAGREEREIALTVLGNDRPGIVREVSATLANLGLSVERMTAQTRDAAMAGGRLFEATIVARASAEADLAGLRERLERLASEIQVDIVVGTPAAR
ncbi:MAG: ACT domain-containing protein [Micrococcales bacterium]|nr:ACT domain-containing protein [Micrococcales bacterium]